MSMDPQNYECENCGAKYGLIIYAGDSIVDDENELSSDLLYCPFCTSETYINEDADWELVKNNIETDDSDIDEILYNREQEEDDEYF